MRVKAMLDVGTTLIAAAERDPAKLALVDGELRLDYAGLLERAGRVAAGLQQLGLPKGSKLLVVLQNRAEMAILHWAAQLAAFVITPVNWRVNASELDFFAVNSECQAIVYEPASEAAVMASQAKNNCQLISVQGAKSANSSIDDLYKTTQCLRESLAGPDDLSLMFYTSGTTGQGKGVPRRHSAERAAALAHVAQNCYRYGEVTLGVMPLYHTMGVRSLLAMALINGVFVCQPRFDAKQALSLIEREKITNLYLVPTLYHGLVSHADFSSSRVASVRKLGFAGASMTDGLLLKVDAAFKPELFVNHYGSSEIYTFTIDQNARLKPGSAGKAGVNARIRIVKIGSTHPDEGVTQGEEGQIIASLQGDEAFDGYWKRPDADARSLHHGWYFTGDVGYADADGDIFITGRVDDMIITGGENVLPVEIESVLSMHPGVSEVAVVGLPDDRWGQAITAFVKRNAPVTEQELDAWCLNSVLAKFKRPRRYVFVAEVPKSPVGKILRRLLVAGEFRAES